MPHPDIIDPVTFIDLLLAVCFIASITFEFCENEFKRRGDDMPAKVAHYTYFAIPLLMLVYATKINDVVFHFSGIGGLIVATLLAVSIFSVAPMVVTYHVMNRPNGKHMARAEQPA